MPLFLLTRGVGMGGSAVAPDPCDAGGEAEPTNPRGTTLGLPRLRGDGKETDWSSLRRAMGILSGYSWPVVDRSGTNELTTVITTDNIESVGLPVVDTTSIVKGSGDATKELRFEVDQQSTGTTRVWTTADRDLDFRTLGLVFTGPNTAYTQIKENEISSIDASAADVTLQLRGQGKGSVDIDSLTFGTAIAKTISAGAITVSSSFITVDTQNDDPTDDLDTITVDGGVSSVPINFLIMHPENDARTIVVKHGTGNIKCIGNADITLDDVHDFAILVYDGGNSQWMAFG